MFRFRFSIDSNNERQILIFILQRDINRSELVLFKKEHDQNYTILIMNVNILFPSNNGIFPIRVAPSHTVLQVKTILSTITQIPIERYILKFNHKTLPDEKNLISLHIRDDDIVECKEMNDEEFTQYQEKMKVKQQKEKKEAKEKIEPKEKPEPKEKKESKEKKNKKDSQQYTTKLSPKDRMKLEKFESHVKALMKEGYSKKDAQRTLNKYHNNLRYSLNHLKRMSELNKTTEKTKSQLPKTRSASSKNSQKTNDKKRNESEEESETENEKEEQSRKKRKDSDYEGSDSDNESEDYDDQIDSSDEERTPKKKKVKSNDDETDSEELSKIVTPHWSAQEDYELMHYTRVNALNKSGLVNWTLWNNPTRTLLAAKNRLVKHIKRHTENFKKPKPDHDSISFFKAIYEEYNGDPEVMKTFLDDMPIEEIKRKLQTKPTNASIFKWNKESDNILKALHQVIGDDWRKLALHFGRKVSPMELKERWDFLQRTNKRKKPKKVEEEEEEEEEEEDTNENKDVPQTQNQKDSQTNGKQKDDESEDQEEEDQYDSQKED